MKYFSNVCIAFVFLSCCHLISGKACDVNNKIKLINAYLVDTANENKEKRVVIIGAGASGIAASIKLIENGYKNVKILEAENRLGGRIHTVPFGENVVDMGAHM